MKPEVWTPQRAATRLVRIAETFSNAHGLRRFPVDVRQLALGAADIFGWKDPITEVQAAPIKKFEGALFPDDDRSRWLLLYNQTLTSLGRIRFTMAHELGHYILHRLQRDSFECSPADMLNWSQDEKDMEGQADLFASYLLMPLDDYRAQVGATVDLDVLGRCAERYGVSLGPMVSMTSATASSVTGRSLCGLTMMWRMSATEARSLSRPRTSTSILRSRKL